MDILERLVEAERIGVRDGKVRHTRDWCEKAGVSGGYLSVFRSNYKKGKQAELTHAKLKALARVVGVNPVWLIDGEGPMVDVGAAQVATAPPSASDRLVLEIGNCPNEKLRQALLLFWFEHRDEPARHAVTRFLYDQDFKGAAKLTVEQWTQELKEHANRVAKGMGFGGVGARPLPDDE